MDFHAGGTSIRQIPKGLDGEEFNQWLRQRAETAKNYDSSDSDL